MHRTNTFHHGPWVHDINAHLVSLQMLENFRVEKQRHMEVQSTFELILLPDKPIILTLKPLSSWRQGEEEIAVYDECL